MSKSYHMRQSVEGALRNRAFDHFQNTDGTPMSAELAEHRLTELLAKGVKYLPCGNCDNWSDTEGCLGHEPAPMDALLRLMQCESDIKQVIRLVPHGDRFRYMIETPFATFPKFVIGTTDAAFEDVRIESRCGLLSTAEEAWARRPAGSLSNGH
jgi:hypothetical protein